MIKKQLVRIRSRAAHILRHRVPVPLAAIAVLLILVGVVSYVAGTRHASSRQPAVSIQKSSATTTHSGAPTQRNNRSSGMLRLAGTINAIHSDSIDIQTQARTISGLSINPATIVYSKSRQIQSIKDLTPGLTVNVSVIVRPDGSLDVQRITMEGN